MDHPCGGCNRLEDGQFVTCRRPAIAFPVGGSCGCSAMIRTIRTIFVNGRPVYTGPIDEPIPAEIAAEIAADVEELESELRNYRHKDFGIPWQAGPPADTSDGTWRDRPPML